MVSHRLKYYGNLFLENPEKLRVKTNVTEEVKQQFYLD